MAPPLSPSQEAKETRLEKYSCALASRLKWKPASLTHKLENPSKLFTFRDPVEDKSPPIQEKLRGDRDFVPHGRKSMREEGAEG